MAHKYLITRPAKDRAIILEYFTKDISIIYVAYQLADEGETLLSIPIGATTFKSNYIAVYEMNGVTLTLLKTYEVIKKHD